MEVSSYFNPRSPCGERPANISATVLPVPFQSTLSLRRATYDGDPNEDGCEISIHALLAESDAEQFALPDERVFISIHALLAESDSKYHQIGPIVSV